MENKKQATVAYAAIIREFEMYGRGRSLKQFCDDSSYVYPNVLRYIIRWGIPFTYGALYVSKS